ncbi:MAG: hypothetical protein U0528_16155 [Anaerolineae bacterium]|nr:hypothetical protein [Anaerolineae bacterium]
MMYADPAELKRMQQRVERRVRGKVLYYLHLGIAFICSTLAMLSIFISFFTGYGSVYGWSRVLAPFQVVLFFGFTLSAHTLLRWLNHMAERTRQSEMERELRRAGYYGEIEKRKREADAFARLTDDGELAYEDSDLSTASARR